MQYANCGDARYASFDLIRVALMVGTGSQCRHLCGVVDAFFPHTFFIWISFFQNSCLGRTLSAPGMIADDNDDDDINCRFSYRIRIENRSSRHVQLIGRFWSIQELNDNENGNDPPEPMVVHAPYTGAGTYTYTYTTRLSRLVSNGCIRMPCIGMCFRCRSLTLLIVWLCYTHYYYLLLYSSTRSWSFTSVIAGSMFRIYKWKRFGILPGSHERTLLHGVGSTTVTIGQGRRWSRILESATRG